MSNWKWLKKLTPQTAWQKFNDLPVEIFVSDFYLNGITDVAEMCQQFALEEVPKLLEGRFFTLKQLEHIALLLCEYVTQYISEQGGIENLKIYTEEELEENFADEGRQIIKSLKRYTTEELIELFGNKTADRVVDLLEEATEE